MWKKSPARKEPLATSYSRDENQTALRLGDGQMDDAGFEFAIHTPSLENFRSSRPVAAAHAPSVCYQRVTAEITTTTPMEKQTRTGMFAIQFNDRGVRLFDRDFRSRPRRVRASEWK